METARLLKSDPFLRSATQRALLESFVIHTRNLIEFFYGKIKKGDEILAEQFVPTWPTVRTKQTALLEDAQNRAHVHIAHLTYKRLEVINEDNPWPVSNIAQELSAVYEKFHMHLPKGIAESYNLQTASANVAITSSGTSSYVTSTWSSETVN
jgi:hypothetical protein